MTTRIHLILFILVFSVACSPPMAGQESQPTRPNILICIADDWSHGHAGCYGCKWVATPAFDRIARQGVLFQRAYTPNAKCAPSRACLLTGRNSWQLKEACNHVCNFPPEFRSFIEVLGENGYTTGHTGKGWGPGRAVDKRGKPRQLTGPSFRHHKSEQPLARGIAKLDYAANFEKFLTAASNDQPWCFWFGASEPHRRYEFGSGVRIDGKRTSLLDRVPGFWPDSENIRNDLLDYAHEVEHFDSHIEKMLTTLESRGRLKNTIVIVTSDHGMPFPRCKGQAYDMSNHIPLAIMWGEGIQHTGRRIADYVSLIDIAPSLVSLAGLNWRQTGMAESPGRSLVPLLRSSQSGQIEASRDYVLIGKERHDVGRPDDVGYPIRGIVSDNKLFIRNYHPSRWPAGDPVTGYLNCDGSPTKTEILLARRANGQSRHWDLCFGKRPGEELYDLAVDPDCLNNLAVSKPHQPLRMKLVNKMEALLSREGDPRLLGSDPDQFDRIEYASKSHRDFYNRQMQGENVRAGWVSETDAEASEIKLPLP